MAEPLALGVMTVIGESAARSFQTVHGLGIHTIQLSYPGQLDSDGGIAQIQAARDGCGLEINTVFCSFPGENYSDIPTVRATVGLVPDDTRAERVAHIDRTADFAQKLDIPRVAAHIGFIPEDAADARYPVLVQTVAGVCDSLAGRGQVFALETGQETSGTLRRFICDVARPNLRVNFDPANMILYGNDKPIPAVDVLAPWIDGVHCKDGRWPTEKDKLGHEMPLGEGDVDVPAWIRKLVEIGYTGPLTIEREIEGEKQREDILRAKALLEGLVLVAQG